MHPQRKAIEQAQEMYRKWKTAEPGSDTSWPDAPIAGSQSRRLESRISATGVRTPPHIQEVRTFTTA